MTDFADTFEKFVELIEGGMRSQTIYDDGREHHVLVNKEIVTYKQPWSYPTHRSGTIDDFTKYINMSFEDHQRCIVSVEERRAVAYINWGERYGTREAILDFIKTDSMISCESLFHWKSPKSVWDRLVLHLEGKITPNTLALLIKEVQLNVDTEAKINIQETGLQDSSVMTKVKLTMGGSEIALPLRYRYSGPVFTCDRDSAFGLDMRLEVGHEDNSPLFKFHPLNHDEFLEDARLSVIGQITEAVGDGVEVYDGTFSR